MALKITDRGYRYRAEKELRSCVSAPPTTVDAPLAQSGAHQGLITVLSTLEAKNAT